MRVAFVRSFSLSSFIVEAVQTTDKKEIVALLEQMHIKEKAEAMQKKHTFWESQPVKQFAEEENSDAVEEGPVQVNQVRETSLDCGACVRYWGIILASLPSRTPSRSDWVFRGPSPLAGPRTDLAAS